jgi:flagellar export protein FliJ
MEHRKLKRMLELKKRIEQAKKGEVVNARHELDAAHTELSKAQAEQRARVEALSAEVEINVNELADRARFVVLAGKQVGLARERVSERDREFAAREQDRVIATRDVRTFEVLNERARSEQRASDKSAEQRASDDLSSARWSSK